jgi:hypothetical protein
MANLFFNMMRVFREGDEGVEAQLTTCRRHSTGHGAGGLVVFYNRVHVRHQKCEYGVWSKV